MKSITGRLRLRVALVTLALLIGGLLSTMHAHATAPFRVSADVGTVPSVPAVQLVSADPNLPAFQTSAAQALETVKSVEPKFGFHDSDIDQTVVPALVTVLGNPQHRDEPAWVIVVNKALDAPGPPKTGLLIMYRKLIFIVNATTGHWEYAYTADPQIP